MMLTVVPTEWGDPDALSEAGFCYANGVGTKKDMKKAAKFYRMAEAKGVNMVGNSWIWKDKYLDDEDRAMKAKKAGGGSTTTSGKKEGGLFSRKKSTPS
jgi:TPR repeat protein